MKGRCAIVLYIPLVRMNARLVISTYLHIP